MPFSSSLGPPPPSTQGEAPLPPIRRTTYGPPTVLQFGILLLLLLLLDHDPNHRHQVIDPIKQK